MAVAKTEEADAQEDYEKTVEDMSLLWWCVPQGCVSQIGSFP